MTPSSKFSFSVLPIIFVFLLQTHYGDAYLAHFCSAPANLINDYPYMVGIQNLFNNLSYTTPRTGFAMDSYGRMGHEVHWLSLCDGSVSHPGCSTCVIDATRELLQNCRNHKSASIIKENCWLKYSSRRFFGEIDHATVIYRSSSAGNESEPKLFNHKAKELIGELAEKASNKSMFYATGDLKLHGAGRSRKIYGSAQCTRDLYSEACKQCLDELAERLPQCCDGRPRGWVISTSCAIRYDTYKFFKNNHIHI